MLKIRLTRRDLVLAASTSGLFLGAVSVGWIAVGELTVLAALVVVFATLIVLELDGRRRVRTMLATQDRDRQVERHVDYRQLEGLISLQSLLPIKFPLPPMRGGWVISPDFANLLVSQILERKPRLILEAGSGVSTLIAAYCLKPIGGEAG